MLSRVRTIQIQSDNFKVVATTATFCLTVVKQLLDDNGVATPGLNWPMQLTDNQGATNNFFTNTTDGSATVCALVAGTYTVAEVPVYGFNITGLQVNGSVLPAQSIYSFLWTTKSPNPFVVTFQNTSVQVPE